MAKEKEVKEEEKNAVEEDSTEEKIVVEAVEESDVVEEAPPADDEEFAASKSDIASDYAHWNPKTEIGRKVKAAEIRDIDEILDSGKPILEAEIVDILLPDIKSELLMIGQSKGKFGGGAKRIFKQTQKKTREGNKPHFATMAVVGNENGYVGIGYGKSKETVPAREKAIRNAKLGIIKIRRGCGSWQCNCKAPHSIPFKVEGKSGSVSIKLIPAPKGNGLVVEKEVAKILKLAGIKDVWAKSSGHTKTKTNLIKATMEALRKLQATKVQPQHLAALNIVEGRAGAGKDE
ncbi:30S ribosomal protein S5 [Candidatus Woesearchaeota archaeon]|nr:MAG: 30S ribosomal protein S5 [Candidatus Woesearchaeota archaeon]